MALAGEPSYSKNRSAIPGPESSFFKELTTRLSTEFGDAVDIVLIERSDGFIFGFSKLDVMFGRALPAAPRIPWPRPA